MLTKLIKKAKMLFDFFLIYSIPKNKEAVVRNFHKLYYESRNLGGTWTNNKYFGLPVQKCPLDLFVYQEIVFEKKPDVIIECGTAYGGTALYLAHILDNLGFGKIITIDNQDFPNRPKHARINYILGSSTDEVIVAKVKELVGDSKGVMVILDSDHRMAHVARELELYAPMVSSNQYLIVEDTNVNANPVCPEHGPGPKEALDAFDILGSGFTVDTARENAYLTFNPGGYLLKS